VFAASISLMDLLSFFDVLAVVNADMCWVATLLIKAQLSGECNFAFSIAARYFSFSFSPKDDSKRAGNRTSTLSLDLSLVIVHGSEFGQAA
jgi:hypothetical protein